MSETPIAHVTDTAFWVATYRANESARPDALFRDPLAARLVEERGRDIAERIAGGEQVAWVVVLRTLIIDDFIRQAIAELPDRQRAAVIMHKYEELEYTQIAEALSCSPQTVKSLLFRAYNTLRVRLAHMASN